MQFQTLFFVALACALCWVNADGSAGQLDESGIEIRSGDEGVTGNDLEDRAFSTYSLECLQAHNDYRKLHGVPPLALDRNVTALAENWAKTMAANDWLIHSPSTNRYWGENLYQSKMSTKETGKDPVDLFYEGIEYYNFDVPGTPKIDPRPLYHPFHFTQVVWKSSKLMGVGVAKGKTFFYVAIFYYPRGNVYGRYAENVLRPL